MQEHRLDFCYRYPDPLLKNLKQIYGYKLENYWSTSQCGIWTSDKHGFPETGDPQLFLPFREPYIYSKADDLAPAKYNTGAEVRNSLVASGCILNGTVENSVLFKQVFVKGTA